MQYVPLHILRVVERRADAVPLLREAGEAVVVTRGRDRLLVMRCPCGCGEDVIVNLDPDAGPAWVLYRNRRGTSVYPSVWRDTGCGSHFIIWDDKILLFSPGPVMFEDGFDRDIDRKILDTIQRIGGVVEFREIARSLDEVPWTVLASCRRLSLAGELTEVVEGLFAPGRT